MQYFIADVVNKEYEIHKPGDWLVLKPCRLTVNPNYQPNKNDIVVKIATDDVSLYGTWEQLNHIEIEYGTYRPPAFVLQEV